MSVFSSKNSPSRSTPIAEVGEGIGPPNGIARRRRDVRPANHAASSSSSMSCALTGSRALSFIVASQHRHPVERAVRVVLDRVGFVDGERLAVPRGAFLVVIAVDG